MDNHTVEPPTVWSDRLSVFDASILPMIPRANTNLTCIAVGERAVGLLR